MSFEIQNGVLKKYSGNDEKVVIPDGVFKIGESAFSGNRFIQKVEIPKSVVEIEYFAFYECTNLRSIFIPDNVRTIGPCIFAKCDSLESIVVSNGNNTYYSDGNCIVEKKSKTIITGCKNSKIPTNKNVINIADRAFLQCNLTSITIPDNIVNIGIMAFSECSNLAHIVIQNKNAQIHTGAFKGCSGVPEIRQKNLLTKILGFFIKS